MANHNANRQNQKKYVKYERGHSNSLWHICWSEYNKNEKLLIIKGDSSRFIGGLEYILRKQLIMQ